MTSWARLSIVVPRVRNDWEGVGGGRRVEELGAEVIVVEENGAGTEEAGDEMEAAMIDDGTGFEEIGNELGAAILVEVAAGVVKVRKLRDLLKALLASPAPRYDTADLHMIRLNKTQLVSVIFFHNFKVFNWISA